MTDHRSGDVPEGGPSALEAPFRLAAGGYAGALVAALAATAFAFEGASTLAVGVAAALAGAVGAAVGAAGAGRGRGLAERLGRTRRRWLAPLAALPFAATALVSPWLTAFGTRVRLVALGSAIVVALAGYVVAVLARTLYVDAVAGDEPVATWRWKPGRSRTRALDTAFVALSAALAVGGAIGGEWVTALLWAGFGAFWLIGRAVEGRLRLPLIDVPTRAQLRVHEVGLVTDRPYARSLVPWSSVSRVRLTPEELILDRGLVDVHFDRDDLEDPERVRDAIDRALSGPESRDA